MKVVRAVRRRDRPGRLPDAARQASRSSSSGRTRGGTRRRRRGRRARSPCRPARATRSARAGWASARRASASTARRRTARSATRSRTAASACTSRRRSGCSTTSTSARRCTSSLPDAHAQAHRPGRRAGGGGRSARLARLAADASVEPPKIGGPAPAFSLAARRHDGTLDLASLRGKPVVLNFWASWCVPCKGEAPTLEQAWQQYRAQGVVFVGVDYHDVTSDARAFLDAPRRHVPDGAGRLRRRRRPVRRERGARDVLHRPPRAGSSASTSSGTVVNQKDAFHARGRGGARLVIVRGRRRARAAALALAGAAAAACAQPHTSLAALEGEIMCPTCHTTLDQSDSPAAQRDRALHPACGSTQCATEGADQGGARRRTSAPASSPRRRARASTCSRGGCRSAASSLGARRSSPSASGAGAARAARRRAAADDRRSTPRPSSGSTSCWRDSTDGHAAPDRVPRGIRVGDHPVRAAARARLPLGALERRGGPARRARARRGASCSRACRSSSASRSSSSSSAPARRRSAAPSRRARRRRSRASCSSCSASRFVGLLPVPERLLAPGLLDRRAPARLGRAPRRRVRGLRGAVHRHGARRGARARERHGHGAQGRGAPRRVRARPRRRVPRSPASRSRARCRAFRWLRDRYHVIQVVSGVDARRARAAPLLPPRLVAARRAEPRARGRSASRRRRNAVAGRALSAGMHVAELWRYPVKSLARRVARRGADHDRARDRGRPARARASGRAAASSRRARTRSCSGCRAGSTPTACRRSTASAGTIRVRSPPCAPSPSPTRSSSTTTATGRERFDVLPISRRDRRRRRRGRRRPAPLPRERLPRRRRGARRARLGRPRAAARRGGRSASARCAAAA